MDIAKQLSHIPLFQGLEPQYLQTLARIAVKKFFKRGETVFAAAVSEHLWRSAAMGARSVRRRTARGVGRANVRLFDGRSAARRGG